MDRERKVIVDFETDARRFERLDGINVRFHVTKTANACLNKAKISIANLTMENIHHLTTFTSPYLNVKTMKRVRLYAGYEQDFTNDIPPIFEGNIVKAAPTSTPPDIWLDIEAMTGFFANQNLVSYSYNGPVSVKEVAHQIAKDIGIPVNYMAVADKKIESFNHNGGAQNAIKKFNQIGGVTAFEDDGVLKVVDAENPKVGQSVRMVDKHSGLIGVPQVDCLGVKFKMLLDPFFAMGGRVQVKSELIPQINDNVYWAYTVTHTGSLRGREFYTEVEARRWRI